ncbi:hypothetical protein [Pseudogracilibacillus auburnensis]|uniref:hypothetical protein n=1 Tax=Pseudogracilibacillus auburnensis TaxID=1494959 RepID=UPI001A9790CC|nr:hypothetical protein [Pseudogracilibacillus auburnensis]MBO1003151.1 hypothetical protein [Pseudogracilibacillus auburnensis]
MPKVTLTEQCISCKKIYGLKVHPKDIVRLSEGAHVQDAMPYLSADDRELLISGICGKCFDEIPFEEDN